MVESPDLCVELFVSGLSDSVLLLLLLTVRCLDPDIDILILFTPRPAETMPRSPRPLPDSWPRPRADAGFVPGVATFIAEPGVCTLTGLKEGELVGDSGFSLTPFITGGDVTGDRYALGDVILGNVSFGDILMLGESFGVHGDCFGDTLVPKSAL